MHVCSHVSSFEPFAEEEVYVVTMN